MSALLTTEEFVGRAREKHGSKFDYSLTEYRSAKERIIIGCPDHGEFHQTPDKHLQSRHACPKCWDQARLQHGKSRRKPPSNEEWLIGRDQYWQRLILKLHPDFVVDMSKYEGLTLGQVTITCPKHGASTHVPRYFLLLGNGCAECGKPNRHPKVRSFTEFLQRLREAHGDDYTIPYPEEYENRKSKLTVHCAKHGRTFTKSGQKLLAGQKCSPCRKEELIADGTLSGGYSERLFAEKPELAAAPATIYYLRVGSVWKVGITRNKLARRLSHIKYEAGEKPQVLDTLSLPLREAFLLEQAILKDFQRVRTYAIWSSEVFTEDVLSGATLRQYAAALKEGSPLAL